MTEKEIDSEGIDEKYYEWKDLFIHSILKPVIGVKDVQHEFTIYGTRNHTDIKNAYDEETINRIDKNYNLMVLNGQLKLIRLSNAQEIDVMIKDGYDSATVFAVFKDDLLKALPKTYSSYILVDPQTFIQQNLN